MDANIKLYKNFLFNEEGKKIVYLALHSSNINSLIGLTTMNGSVPSIVSMRAADNNRYDLRMNNF